MKVPPYKVHCALCDEDFTASSFLVMGGKRLSPSICNPCAIKWDYIGCPRKSGRKKLLAELARELGVTMDDAHAVMLMPFKAAFTDPVFNNPD